MSYTYAYPRAMITVDILLIATQTPSVLLIKRKNEPFRNCWALPGGFVDMGERLIEAANRELFEETGIGGQNLHFFRAYDAIHRDPRGRNIAMVHYAVIETETEVQGKDDALEARWFRLNSLPDLAFDHAEIIDHFLIDCKPL
ncbi:MAG TPA: NUDIX hydrolase [Bacteroidales bacterium]|nr:NUDIX hydrolase [Bacteroidales bacterium]